MESASMDLIGEVVMSRVYSDEQKALEARCPSGLRGSPMSNPRTSELEAGRV